MERIQTILKHYKTPEEIKLFQDTVTELIRNGVGNGCYQDYVVLHDVISILANSEMIIRGY